MCGPYWSQFDRSDLDSWQWKDYPGHDEEDDTDLCQEKDDTNLDQEDCCPRCSGGGCNYCLMLSYQERK